MAVGVLVSFDDVVVERDGVRALDGFRAAVPEGGVTAVFGPSGSGKSTMLRLCNRLEVPTAGRVLFREEDIAVLDPLWLRRRVGMCFQRPTPFPGTVTDNLRVADPQATDSLMQDVRGSLRRRDCAWLNHAMQRRFSVIALCVVMLTVASCATGKEPSTSFTPPTAIATPPSSSTSGPATAPPLGQPVRTPVIGSVLAPPSPVAATDGKLHLAYELVLTNTLQQPITLTSLAALAGEKTLLNLSGDGLAYWTRSLGAATPSTKLGPAQTALVWLDVAVDKAWAVPSDITHTIGLTVTQPQPPLVPATITETIAPTKVNTTAKPVIISPPLTGPSWVNGDGCCGMSAHRIAVNPLNGQLWAAERFAIDFVQLTPEGRLFIGDKTKPESYPYFGADIHAVANGPIIAVVNNQPEQVPGTNPTGLPLDQYGGNHIVQDIGGGNYAFYGHLRLGSVRVKVGDKLSSGETIASLGNSGNTSAPHLHFQVMSTPDPLLSNGLPFVFNKFRLDSRVASGDALNRLADIGGPVQLQPGFPGGDQTDTMPLDLDVMTYLGK